MLSLFCIGACAPTQSHVERTMENGVTARPSHIKGEGKERGVEFISETNNRLVLQATTEENSLLVLSDTYYPGWEAFVDGKKTKIYRADYTFRAIPLDAGRS